MKPIDSTNLETWTKQPWQGNSSLNLICSCKFFKYNTRKIPVWIFGGTVEYPTFSFCVNAGANSDYSYTGGTNGITDLATAEQFVDNLYKESKLIY